ncbi:unnamed protein product [Cercopithifilaria johnstoni]|uniref:GPI transamidase component PIG-S n=1 Tax=Cercopithifilaria johnstoni TaxID=2874296 RepID=A0A8J2PSW2_9BILA|nr:unnamed protein product [Cercopithifilaria johnstoni]
MSISGADVYPVHNFRQERKEERTRRVLMLTAEERAELPFRRISSLAFIVIMLIFGLPLWWQTTSTYRVPFRIFPSDQQIALPVYVSIASSYSSMKSHVGHAITILLNELSELPEIDRLHLVFKLNHEDMDTLESISRTNTERNNFFGVHIAIINETVWPYSGYTTYFDDQWALILNCEDESKLAQRMFAAITDVLLDTGHLSAIVRRDLRQRIQSSEIVALSSSQQKRLIWDSVALSARYIVQVIFLHAGHNQSSEHCLPENIILHTRRFATKLAEVSDLIISSEHLWDFDLTAWLKKDVQERITIQLDDISQIVTAIEQETSTVESSAPVMKLIVLDAPQPIALLDYLGDESNGVVVASWGALLSYGGRKHLAVNQSIIAAMRVLFGLDTDLPVSYDRLPLPVAKWEIKRIKLRSFIDCSINGISSVAAIHKLISQIDNIVINEEVANKTNLAVKLISQALSTVEKTGYIDVVSVAEGRALAESALNDKSLLSLLYFPNDQKFAIYLPLFLPTLLPLFGSILALNRYWMGKE